MTDKSLQNPWVGRLTPFHDAWGFSVGSICLGEVMTQQFSRTSPMEDHERERLSENLDGWLVALHKNMQGVWDPRTGVTPHPGDLSRLIDLRRSLYKLHDAYAMASRVLDMLLEDARECERRERERQQ